MKIALVQGRVRSDRPADNLENIKTALKREELGVVQLAVFPSQVLMGRLGPGAVRRPGLEVQLKKVWEDFLALSADHPKTALAASCLNIIDGRAVEEAFVVRAGEVLARGGRAGGPLTVDLDGQMIALHPSDLEPKDADAGEFDLMISLKNSLFQGEAYFPPSFSGARAWRINVSAVGGEGPYIYDGATWVYSPGGKLKGWAHGFENTMVILDTKSLSLPDLNPLPKREPLEVLQQALTFGLRDFVRANGSGRVLLGLSGGLDSAVCCVLAVDALGAENVLGVAMPSEFNAPESLDLARDLSKNMGINFLTLPIDNIRESFAKAFLLAPKASEQAAGLADENIQARIRGVLLMYMANREERLLLATGNKSEAAMGYTTLYGDTCGAISPIGDVYKSRLFELAGHINQDAERIPRGIITRPPSAELKLNQKDEDSLPPYAVLDDILYRHLEAARSGSLVAKEGGHSPMTVAWVLSTLKKNAFKRDQVPFSLVTSTCPLGGFDWPR